MNTPCRNFRCLCRRAFAYYPYMYGWSVVLMLFPLQLNAEQDTGRERYLDSLYSVWNNPSEEDSNRIHAIDKYIFEGLMLSDADSALQMTHRLDSFVESIDSDEGRSAVQNLYGCYYFTTSDFVKAKEYFERKLEIDKMRKSDKGIARTLGNIGLVYQYQGDYPTAMRYYIDSYEMNKKVGDLQAMANAASNIGVIYMDKGMSSKAIVYLEECRRIEEKRGDKHGLAGTYINIGNLHSGIGNDDLAMEYYRRGAALCDELGNMEFKANALSGMGGIAYDRGDYEAALDYYSQALRAREEVGLLRQVAASKKNLGQVFEKLEDYDNALRNYTEALEIDEEIGFKQGIARSHSHLGYYFRHRNQPDRAIPHCLKAHEISQEIKAYKIDLNACHCLYKSYKAVGNNNSALMFHELKHAMEDSVDVSETARKLQEMEFRERILADSLQQEEEKLRIQMAYEKEVYRQTRTRNIALGSGIMFLLLAGGLFSRNRYINRTKRIIESEKARSDELLLNILPYEIAQELKVKGEAQARGFDLVSILFTDFKDFTETSERLSPSDLVTEIDTCFKAFDAIVEDFGIEKIKTIGDAYMAAGGLPVPSEDAAVRTVEAALEMQAFIEEYKRLREESGKSGFDMRVGIHSGPVVAGIVGVKKFQYDVWGDTVNTASRMETNGTVGCVNISQATYDLVKHHPSFEFVPRGQINVKGKGDLRMYYVSKKGGQSEGA